MMIPQLIFYGILVVTLSAGYFGWRTHQRNIGEETATKVWKPKYEVEAGNAKRAEDANHSLAGDVAQLRKLVKEQGLSIARSKSESDRRQAEARGTLARVETQIPGYEAEIARLRAIQNNPVITENDCEEAANIIDGVLRKRLQLNAGAIGNNERSIDTSRSGSDDTVLQPERPATSSDPDPRRTGRKIEEAKGRGAGR